MRVSVLLLSLTPAFSQSLAPDSSGRVTATVAGILLSGASGASNPDTDLIEVNGNARALMPARADRIVIRCCEHAVVTADPVTIEADRISIKDGLLLRARGHVRIVTQGARIEADELDFYVKIADGDARGHERATGEIPMRWDSPMRRWPQQFFPPEIYK